MNDVELTKLEIKVLDKLGLDKSEIFSLIRKDEKENLDQVSYVTVKGSVKGTIYLSFAIYSKSNNITFSTFNNVEKVKTAINSQGFRELLSQRVYSVEKIDSL